MLSENNFLIFSVFIEKRFKENLFSNKIRIEQVIVETFALKTNRTKT